MQPIVTVAQVYTNYNKTAAGKNGQLVVFILCYQPVNVSNTVRIETEVRGSNFVTEKILLTCRVLHLSHCCRNLQIRRWIVDSYKECVI
jgi:hypothetical protein